MQKQMKIMINHQEIEVVEGCHLSAALIIYQLNEPVYAVAVNGKLISKSQYKTTELSALDEVDILIPMQGG